MDLPIKDDQRSSGWRMSSSTRTLKIFDIPGKKQKNKKKKRRGRKKINLLERDRKRWRRRVVKGGGGRGRGRSSSCGREGTGGSGEWRLESVKERKYPKIVSFNSLLFFLLGYLFQPQPGWPIF